MDTVVHEGEAVELLPGPGEGQVPAGLGGLLWEHGPVADGQAMGAPRCGSCSERAGVAVPWPCEPVGEGAVVTVKPWGWTFRQRD